MKCHIKVGLSPRYSVLDVFPEQENGTHGMPSSTVHKLQRLPWENYEIKMNAFKGIYGDWEINDRIFLYFLYMQITDTFNARRK